MQILVGLGSYSAFAQSTTQAPARTMPGFPVISALKDQEFNRRNILIQGKAQVTLKNVARVAQTGMFVPQNGSVKFDHFSLKTGIIVANCDGDNEGETLAECCGTAGDPMPWVADTTASFKACKRAFNRIKSCDLPPLVTTLRAGHDYAKATGSCKNGNATVVTPGTDVGTWKQNGTEERANAFSASVTAGRETFRTPASFVFDPNDGYVARPSEDAKLSELFSMGQTDSLITIGKTINCRLLSTGLSCVSGVQTPGTNDLRTCKRNSAGNIVDDEPCISVINLTSRVDIEVNVDEDAGAIMGTYFAYPSIFGGGESDRDRVTLPLNSGLPF